MTSTKTGSRNTVKGARPDTSSGRMLSFQTRGATPIHKLIVGLATLGILLGAGIAGAVAGTISTTFSLPNSVKVIVPTEPPMGQEYAGAGALVVPPGVTWRLVGFTFNIMFDATKPGVGNISLVVRDPDGISHLRIPLANGLDRASRYVDFSGWVGAPQSPAATIDHECILASIPPDLVLPAGWQLTTLTEGRRSTDRVKEMQLWVQEMPE